MASERHKREYVPTEYKRQGTDGHASARRARQVGLERKRLAAILPLMHYRPAAYVAVPYFGGLA